jgi:hypothetical protein
MNGITRKIIAYGIFAFCFSGCGAKAPILPGTAPRAVDIWANEATISWEPAVLEGHEIKYRVIRLDSDKQYQELAAGAGKPDGKESYYSSEKDISETTVRVKGLGSGYENTIAVLAISQQNLVYSVYPLLKLKTLSIKEQRQRRTDRLLEEAMGELKAGAVRKYPRIPNAITRMEYPEYHSFIYRYERIRDEQLALLEESIGQYAFSVDLKNSRSLNSAGYGLYERQDYANAVRFFREAAYIDPSYVYPHYNLACTLSIIRDSIWADPEAGMDYHHDFNGDYYAVKYSLYEPDDNYFDQADNDEICRNEIFDHLALACLLDKQYPEKAPADRDLAGVHNTLRFRRLMENLRTGNGAGIYGIWYDPENVMKETFFMRDGSIMHILPNDRPSYESPVAYHNNYRTYHIYQDFIQGRTKKEYRFDDLITGYEGFISDSGGSRTAQWDYKDDQFIINNQILEVDYYKLGIAPGPYRPLKFDYTYYEDTYFRNYKDSLETKPSASSMSIDADNKYINIYAPPYRFVLDDDIAPLTKWLKDHGPETANILAALALIYDRSAILDWLITHEDSVALNRLFLLSHLYVKPDLITRLENGAYGFNVDNFREKMDLLRYAVVSGNVPLFKMAYAKYYQAVKDFLINTDDFNQSLISRCFVTGNNQMYDIMTSIQKGTYNGDL